MDAMNRIKTLTNTVRDMSIESKTGVILALTFFFSLFLSLFFVIGPAVKANWAVSGGSDAYYNMRIVQYILSTHHQLLFDPGLNYPMGIANPRPPFFHWLIVLLGYAFSPFLGGVTNSTLTMFLASTAIGGAFIVFPTYFLGKELFGYKVGLIAAILVALSPLTMMKSIGSIGLFDIFTALFGLMFIYFFLKAVNSFKYDSPDTPLIKSIFESIRSNPISVTYALLAGVSLAASMLTWVGSISLILILVGAAVVQMVIFTLKKKSTLSVFITNLIFGSGFLVAFPWYYVAHFVPIRFDYPLILWGLLLLVSIYFLFLRRRPWLVSVGLFVVLAVAGVALLYKFDSSLLYAILSGQHYFVKNKIYDTIAEAQALPLGEDLLEFGAFSFFASFIGLAYLVYKWVRTATFNMTLAVLYFGGIIVISMIASKFLYFGATAASILTGYIVVRAFELLAFREAIEKSRGRSIKNALRREFKFAHYAIILIVVFLLIVPTTFYAVDSAIPYNNKTTYDRELYNNTPSFLKPANYSAPYYLGAFGASLATPNQPWNTALSWFKNQDTQLAPSQRPAFISWWDYGFQTLEQGNHPVMADNFQDGIYPAAQILLAQNESEIVSVMITQMLQNYSLTGNFNNSPAIQVLEQYLGQNATNSIMGFETNSLSTQHQNALIDQIKADPSYYGNHSSSIQGGDAIYIVMEHFLTNTFSLNTLINLYSAIEQLAGKSMSYVSVDYGLFPFNGTNTGIFYAPSFLGDFPYVNASGEIVPTTFYSINVTDINGNTYPIQNFPSGDTAASYSISYTSAFYNSTIYRAFIGYPPSVIGASNGIPGYSSNISSYPAMQGWGMANFEVAYKTVLWNPYTDYKNHSNAWKTVSLEQGYSYMKNHDGTTDLFPPSYVLSNDVIFLHYYPGAIISGKVTNSNGQALPGVRVTLTDQYGIPHQTVLTNSTGYYSIYAVAGNDRVTYSTGTYNPIYMIGNKSLSYYNITISDAQANRESYNNYGQQTWNITHNLVVNASQINGVVYLDASHLGRYIQSDVTVPAEVKYYNSTFNTTYFTNTTLNGTYQIPNVDPYSYEVSAKVYGTWYNNLASVSVTTGPVSKDIRVDFGTLNASIESGATPPAGSNITFSRGSNSITYNLTSRDQKYYLPTGVYNVSAYSAGSWDNFTTQALNNSTTHLTLSFSQYFRITFIAQINGQPVSVPVVINNGTSTSQTVRTDSNGIGYYSALVSTYTVYSDVYYDGSYYSTSKILNVSGSMTVFLNLQPAYLVSGYYKVNGVGQGNSRVAMVGNDTFVNLLANGTGYFSIYLPVGDYSAVAHSEYNGSLQVASMAFTVSNQEVNLGLIGYQGYEVNGTVTQNGTPVEGLVTSQLNARPYSDTYAGTNGSFSFYLQDGVAIGGLNFVAPGYAVLSTSSNGILLRALPATVSIYASYAGSIPMTLYLNGSQNYVAAGTHYFNLSILPGNYSIAFSHPGTTTSSAMTTLDVAAGISNQNFVTTLSLKARLTVDPTTNVYVFQDGKLVSTSPNATLPIGNYTVYSNSGSTAALMHVYLTNNSTIKLNFVPAYNVTLSTSPSSKVTIATTYGNITWSKSILLPKGAYTFILDVKYNKSYDYYASSTAYISSPETITLNGTITEVVSSVSLSFFYGGSAITSGTYHIQGAKNLTGSFNSGPISLPYGSFSLYATSGNLAYLGGFNVSGPTAAFSFSLQRSYPLNYGTYLNNSSYGGMVSIKGNTNYYLPSSGIINLPNGSYLFRASTTYPYFGYTDNYSINQTVIVSGISSATLSFKIDTIVKVSFLAESGTPLLKERQSITFPLLITSNSNIPLNFTIGNSSTVWINGSGIRLAPYSSGETNVTIKVPPGTVSGNSTGSIRVYYAGTNSEVSFNFTVLLVENVSATITNSTGKIVGNLLEIPFTVFNNGNNKTYVNASIMNAAQLSADGITVTFNNSTTYSSDLYLHTNDSTYLIVNSSSGKSVSGTMIYIILSYGNSTKIVSAELATPALSVSKATGSGHNISPYSHLTQDYYIYAFSAFIVLAMIAVMFIFRRRFRT